MKAIPLSVACRIVAAHFGTTYNCLVIGHTFETKCRLVKDYYMACRVYKSEVLYTGSDWHEVLSKAIPYFVAEYDPNGTTTLGDYCGRLAERRKIREDVQRNSG